MPREKKVPEEDEGVDESWLASWADGMTLLMAFFVMMYAFALVDLDKFQDFKVGIVAALGVADPSPSVAPSNLDGGSGIVDQAGMDIVPSEELSQAIERLEETLEETGGQVTPENAQEVKELLDQRFDAVGAGDDVVVEIDERGVVIRFPDRMLFQSGQAFFDNEIAPIVLGQTALVLSTVENGIDVEGHTDDVPTGRLWPSNWELSGARASAVVRWFHDYGKIPEVRMAAVGLSDTHPRESNASEEGRTANRRVEVVIRVNGMVASDLDLIDPIGDDIIGEGFGSTDSAASASDTGAASTDPASTDPSSTDPSSTDGGGTGPAVPPVEIDPIRTGLEP